MNISLLKKIRFIIVAVIGFLLVIVFFWNNITLPVVNYTPFVGTNDFMDLNYPFRYFLSESLKQGEFPLWSPEISSGYPILAEGQIGGLYPLNILFSLFPIMASVNATIVSGYFLLFIFSFLYLRKIKLSDYASIFGAILVAFSGFAANELMHWGIFNSFYLFVGQLYLLESFLKSKASLSKRLIWVLLMGILLGFSILGGHPQTIMYTQILLGSYWIFFGFLKKSKLSKVKNLLINGISVLIFVGVGFGIGAGQLLPQMEFTRNSTRAEGLSIEALERFNFPISHLATFIDPFSQQDQDHTWEAFTTNGWPEDERYIYMGIVGLAFALFGLSLIRTFNPKIIFFSMAAILAMLLSFGNQFTLGFILRLPPFSFFRIPFRLIAIVNFSLAVLAAMSFDRLYRWFKNKGLKPVLITLILIILMVISFWDLRVNAKKLYPEVNADNWYQEPEVVSFLKDNLKDQERVVSQQYFYPTAKIFLEDPELWDNTQIFVNLRNLLPVFNNLLYQIPKNIGAANSGGLKVKRYNDLEMEIYFKGMKYEESGDITLSDSYLFLNRIMGVRYLLATQPVKSYILGKVREIEFSSGQDSVYVYEFSDYWPRVLMVPKAEYAKPEEIKQHILDADFDLKKKVFLEEETDWGAKGGYAATALFEKYTNQEIIVNTKASGDGFLYLSDTYYPGWKAYVDGQETKIYRANYAFRAVPVAEGEHQVRFVYQPDSFSLGIKISLGAVSFAALSILTLGLFSLISRKKELKSKKT